MTRCPLGLVVVVVVVVIYYSDELRLSKYFSTLSLSAIKSAHASGSSASVGMLDSAFSARHDAISPMTVLLLPPVHVPVWKSGRWGAASGLAPPLVARKMIEP